MLPWQPCFRHHAYSNIDFLNIFLHYSTKSLKKSVIQLMLHVTCDVIDIAQYYFLKSKVTTMYFALCQIAVEKRNKIVLVTLIALNTRNLSKTLMLLFNPIQSKGGGGVGGGCFFIITYEQFRIQSSNYTTFPEILLAIFLSVSQHYSRSPVAMVTDNLEGTFPIFECFFF